jgi:regulator of sirC expression with transglutaminase-like and TPR domain
VSPLAASPVGARLDAVSRVVFGRAGLAGNRAHDDDFRNSYLNAVLERRLGIPISLALVFLEVARRAGVEAVGVSFPGHFLIRGPEDAAGAEPAILDPFDGGRRMSEADLRALLVRMAGEEAPYSPDLLRPCTPRQLLARMLNNLKRIYVELRSFQQARAATELIFAVDPTLLSELRDRGLLAYHLNDHAAALRDLEDFVKLHAWSEQGDKAEREEIWNHVKNLRRRVAGFN